MSKYIEAINRAIEYIENYEGNDELVADLQNVIEFLNNGAQPPKAPWWMRKDA
jgi:hypothetical protein